jgi:hypothetical protein
MNVNFGPTAQGIKSHVDCRLNTLTVSDKAVINCVALTADRIRCINLFLDNLTITNITVPGILNVCNIHCDTLLQITAGTGITATTAAGDIALTATTGSITETAFGNITETAFGNITETATAGDISLTTLSGSITLTSANNISILAPGPDVGDITISNEGAGTVLTSFVDLLSDEDINILAGQNSAGGATGGDGTISIHGRNAAGLNAIEILAQNPAGAGTLAGDISINSVNGSVFISADNGGVATATTGQLGLEAAGTSTGRGIVVAGNNHLSCSGAAPTVTFGGGFAGSATITRTDLVGTITVTGPGGITDTIVVRFNSSFAAIPIVMITNNDTVFTNYTVTATSADFTITATAATGVGSFNYLVIEAF